VHDVEDGVVSHRISLAVLTDPAERAVVAELAAKHFSAEPVSALEDAAMTLCRLRSVARLVNHDYGGSLADQVALKRLTSELVGRFASAAVIETRRVHGQQPLVRYAADLLVPDQVAAEVALLKALALRYVMSDPQRLAMQRGQRELLAELVDALAGQAPDALDPAFRPAFAAAPDDCAKWRVIVDQVASLTDAQALRWHERLLRRFR
jgi:dGTPase